MSDLEIKGELKITKLYNDGRSEVVFDDHNIIVSGMGLGLVYLFSLSGATNIQDFQIDRFQLGLSGASSLEISSTYALSSALSSTAEYIGTIGKVLAFDGKHLYNNVDTSSEVFSKIPFNQVTRINDNSVRYTLYVDEHSCNNLVRLGTTMELNEVGIFMKNPTGYIYEDRSILVAYRSFSGIRKTIDFSLIFDWTLIF